MNRMHPLGPGDTRVVTIRIDSRLDQVELLGKAVRALCTGSGLPARTSAQVELALVEAVNNVIRHAYRNEPGHPVEVVFTLAAEQFTIEVADEGTPMPARPRPRFDFDPTDVAHLPEGGMGLHIIHSVMDHVEYHSRDGRNALTMTRRLAA